MNRSAVERWVSAYERVWRTPGTDRLTELFTADVSYRASPWADAVIGLEPLAEFWEAERGSADEPFTMTSEIVAVEGTTAVVRVAVEYAATGTRWRDLWVVELDGDGRCRAFEEWPFAPEPGDGHGA